ncbi:hypothetical protein FRC07_006064 [Ceratobasidium sp. 392]|nr:hypothetical protein FRC07_006064 [Ceratobasidium sp. 392]
MIDDEHVIRQGEAVIANYSSDRRVITLADEADLSAVVPLTVDKLATFRGTSFAAQAQCESLNIMCNAEGEVGVANCSNLGISAIPLDRDAVQSIALVAPFDPWNETYVQANIMKYGPAYCCGTNPVRSILQLRWLSQRSGAVESPNPAVFTGQIPLIDIYAMCNLTFFNVSVAYDDRAPSQKSWSIVPGSKIQSDDIFATTLSANIKSRAMLAKSVEEVMAALNQELARLALGYVSTAFVFVPATEVEVFKPTTLGRYPVAPLLTFVGLLFLCGLVALGIFVTSLSLASDAIYVPLSLQNEQTSAQGEISVLELARQRLLSPLPLVAQLFERPIQLQRQSSPGDADARNPHRYHRDSSKTRS